MCHCIDIWSFIDTLGFILQLQFVGIIAFRA